MSRRSGPEGTHNDHGRSGGGWSPAYVAAIATVIAAIIGAGATLLANPDISGRVLGDDTTPAGTSPAGTLTAEPAGPQGDASRFVRDVTLPDGTRLDAGARVTKIWEIENIGTVLWSGRFLTRQDNGASGCRTPHQVPIPDTQPGNRVQISVPITMPASGGCKVFWKMTGKNGDPYLAAQRPIFFELSVR